MSEIPQWRADLEARAHISTSNEYPGHYVPLWLIQGLPLEAFKNKPGAAAKRQKIREVLAGKPEIKVVKGNQIEAKSIGSGRAALNDYLRIDHALLLIKALVQAKESTPVKSGDSDLATQPQT